MVRLVAIMENGGYVS